MFKTLLGPTVIFFFFFFAINIKMMAISFCFIFHFMFVLCFCFCVGSNDDGYVHTPLVVIADMMPQATNVTSEGPPPPSPALSVISIGVSE